MAGLVTLIVQGANLGLSARFTPGPLLMYLISQSILGGWKRGAIVAAAQLISDTPLIFVTLLLLNQIPALFLRMISLLGGVYVLYLAWKIIRNWSSPRISQQKVPSGLPGDLLRAIVVNYSGAGPYIFWSLVNGPLLLTALRASILHGVIFLISFYGVFIGGMLGLAGIFSQARRLPGYIGLILALISVVVLSFIGLSLIYRSILLE